MKPCLQNMEDILNMHITGFHRYVLTEPVHMSYVSQNLCQMLGFSKEELLGAGVDLYASRVHPGDMEQYEQFLRKARAGEGSCTVQYRLLKKSGEVLFVSDTITSRYEEDHFLVGDSVLTDITELKRENNNLHFLNETIPCGFIKYTCDDQPHITYINDRMLKMLRFPAGTEGALEELELYKQNIYLMIPVEERRRFAMYLRQVYTKGAPIAGEMTALRFDGTKVYLFGWVTKCVNEEGVEEYQSACMDISERHNILKERETKRYLKALTDVYDKIFEYDLSNRTVKCLCGQSSPVFQWLENIPMQMEEATEKWIKGTVFEEDREKVKRFFADFYQRRFSESDTPPVIQYRALSSAGVRKSYSGIFLKIDSSVSLFCCRSVQNTAEADRLRSENVSLKANMQELVLRFTDGLAAFEVKDGYVTPLYASDNVCNFFGFTRDEWLSMMKRSTPIKRFVSKSEAAYDEFLALLQNGEAEFTYYDLGSEKERRIKAICSQKSPGGASPRYVMLYNVDEQEPPKPEKHTGGSTVSIRTFGYFDVFVGDKPIAFRNKKSEELLALLVDRKGGYVSSEEAIGFLWEDEPVSPVTLARYRKVALRLKNILEEYGISHIVESVDGKRRIATERVQCDLYNYLSGREEYAQLFKGSYLTNYSWGENTLAELMGERMY